MTATKVKRIKFSDEEKFLILEEFTLRKDILVPKNGRYKNTADRQQAWEEIARAVNSLNPLVQRTPKEIHKKWKNMVVDARKELTMEKHPLLRKQPRDRLFQDIFALLHKADGAMPKPSLYDSGSGTEASESPPSTRMPACWAEGLLKPPCLRHLHGDGRNAQPGKNEAPGAGDPNTVASQTDSLRHHLGAALPTTPSREVPFECDREEPPENQERLSGEPCGDDAPWSSLHADKPRRAQLRRTPWPPNQDSGGMLRLGRIHRAPECPWGLASPCKAKCPLSSILEWPYLRSSGSPLSQSSGLSSPSSDGLCSAASDHASAPAADGSPPPQRSCPSPTGGPPRAFWEKQSRLHTEVLELQKETLQLQKEKILLEKEKLLLEIHKLRRELGT
uniref:Myb/SANT-like DNA-binding domain-containing protein n=1 Tax=Pogona vitticeps TaxID=103695 RepID=A0A6J0VHF0_9SAUR